VHSSRIFFFYGILQTFFYPFPLSISFTSKYLVYSSSSASVNAGEAKVCKAANDGSRPTDKQPGCQAHSTMSRGLKVGHTEANIGRTDDNALFPAVEKLWKL
jgi:hypothetical protein